MKSTLKVISNGSIPEAVFNVPPHPEEHKAVINQDIEMPSTAEELFLGVSKPIFHLREAGKRRAGRNDKVLLHWNSPSRVFAISSGPAGEQQKAIINQDIEMPLEMPVRAKAAGAGT